MKGSCNRALLHIRVGKVANDRRKFMHVLAASIHFVHPVIYCQFNAVVVYIQFLIMCLTFTALEICFCMPVHPDRGVQVRQVNQ